MRPAHERQRPLSASLLLRTGLGQPLADRLQLLQSDLLLLKVLSHQLDDPRVTAELAHLLEIYLADHAAAATAGAALAQRAAQSNSTNEYGDFLTGLSAAIEEDRRSLQQIIAQLGFRESRSEEAVAWLGEKLARLKLNGRLREYSPLSRVLELKALSVGIAGKLALSESLLAQPGVRESLSGPDLAMLADRARQQPAKVEQHRLQAAREAFRIGGNA